MPDEETGLVPAKNLTAKEVRLPEHAHLWAIIDKSKDPHAVKAARTHIERLTAAKKTEG